MRLHYGGKYSGNPDDLPHLEHEPGAVPFKEVGDAKKLGVLTTILSIVFFMVAAILCWIRAGDIFFERIAVVPYLLTIIPHELLHALCYKEDVYLYHGPVTWNVIRHWSGTDEQRQIYFQMPVSKHRVCLYSLYHFHDQSAAPDTWNICDIRNRYRSR